MKHDIITEENADRFEGQTQIHNLILYPIKKIDDNIFEVVKKETMVFWGNKEGDSIKSSNVSLKSIGKFDGELSEALQVLKSTLPPSQAFLIYVEGNNISRAMIPLRK